MGITFEKRRDTMFMSYMNIIDNGNYINGADPENDKDYAGYFLLNKVKNNEVQFRIKSYRNENEQYLLALKFTENGKRCTWRIKANAVSYLPKTAVFKDCSASRKKTK